MAYAPYRDLPATAHVAWTSVFQVLDITVSALEACRVRRALVSCKDVGILGCEPLPHAGAASASAAPRVRFSVHLPLSRYAEVIHRVLESSTDGEIGALTSWRAHLARRGLAYGG